MKPTVMILTWCGNPQLLYGTLLTFKTLRVGFPNAKVLVIDNGSHYSVRNDIKEAAESVGAEFYQLPETIHFAEFYKWAITKQETYSSLVIADPDLVFWENCEGWEFGKALMAGRYSPQFFVANPEATMMPRLHTSLLFIPDVWRLKARIAADSGGYFQYDPFYPRLHREGSELFLWDTLGGLYSAIQSECHSFNAPELDAYDHLFCGSHIDLVEPRLSTDSPAMMEVMKRAHSAAANGDIASLKGIWRHQNQAAHHPFIKITES